MMEDEKEGGRAYGHWWWVLASGAQLGLGVSSYRRGYAGDSRLMPLKAFVVASLFVGAAASTAVSVLKASGIHKVWLLSLSLGGVTRRSWYRCLGDLRFICLDHSIDL